MKIYVVVARDFRKGINNRPDISKISRMVECRWNRIDWGNKIKKKIPSPNIRRKNIALTTKRFQANNSRGRTDYGTIIVEVII